MLLINRRPNGDYQMIGIGMKEPKLISREKVLEAIEAEWWKTIPASLLDPVFTDAGLIEAEKGAAAMRAMVLATIEEMIVTASTDAAQREAKSLSKSRSRHAAAAAQEIKKTVLELNPMDAAKMAIETNTPLGPR